MRIKRCPFCGDIPTKKFSPRPTSARGAQDDVILITCENELCDVQPCASDAVEGECVKKWNRRAK